MNLQFENKVVVITGGAKGIGEAITRAFAAEGAIACIFGRNLGDAEALMREAAQLGQRVEFYRVELTNEQEVIEALNLLKEKHGRLDVLVNNAGVNDTIGLRHSVDEFRGSMEKNIVQCFTLVHHALDLLEASRGNIVNIGSKCAVTGQGRTSGYVASKGAMNGLTREWALDLGRSGIRVNCVIPAEVITPLYERWLGTFPDPKAAREQVDLLVPFERRTTTPEEIADTVVFVASARSSHTTGQLLYVDGGYVHLDRACTQNVPLSSTP